LKRPKVMLILKFGAKIGVRGVKTLFLKPYAKENTPMFSGLFHREYLSLS
jgi:hypothetical protein